MERELSLDAGGYILKISPFLTTDPGRPGNLNLIELKCIKNLGGVYNPGNKCQAHVITFLQVGLSMG